MHSKTRTITARLGDFVDSFIPPAIAADSRRRSLARLFLISHLLGPFLGNTVPLSLYILSPAPGWDIAVLAASITGFWLFPIALRLGVRYELLTAISIQNLIFCILWACYFNGGVTSPTLPWMLTIPLLSFFYIGALVRMRTIVLAIFAVNIVGFTAIYTLAPPPSNGIPLEQIQVLGIISTCAASLYTIMMAVYYARALASQAEIETEMRSHLETAGNLQRAAAEAERASIAKSEFLAKMSHELRTPLNAVIGYSQMLLEEAADMGEDDYVDDYRRILASGEHLLRLVNNVLDLSKLEAGRAEFFKEPVSVRRSVDDVVRSLTTLTQTNGNTVEVRVEAGAEVMIGDAMMIQRALSNIVENAVKFTKNGNVAIACRRATCEDGDCVDFVVTDDGPGIPAHELPHLFEQFSVADDLTAAKYGGTGVGLALVHRLATLMGGTVMVDTEVGRGSTFTIRLPLGVATTTEEPLATGKARAEHARDSGVDTHDPKMAVAVNG
jgi:signal transduction histidine kinase